MTDRDLLAAVEGALGLRITSMTPVRGGDVATAYRLESPGRGPLFAKTHASPPPGFFTTEAASLTWLAAAGTALLAVPEVLAVSDGPVAFLVLGWIEEGRPGPLTEAELGRGLAEVHRAGAPCFGREDRRTTGSRGLPNDPKATWAEFYGQCRLLPLARLAHDGRALPAETITRLERLAGSLERFGAADEPPARLHGDLWAGNRLVDRDGRNWLIDPAAHGGHREFDLAMMRLFGGFGPACFQAYQEAHPLASGWEDRVPLHQVAPLVVHAIKFGGGYVRGATAAIEAVT